MYPRLELLRGLLAEDGSIWVSIDDNEGHYLKVIMDEIFGRKNFVANIIWEKRTSRENRRVFSFNHDHLLIYGKAKPEFELVRNTFTKTETNQETDQDEEHEIPYLKGYTVFNVEQIDALPAHYYAKATPPTVTAAERNAKLEAFFAATGATICHGGNRAFYALEPDTVQMPPFEFFKDPESYYATLAHECTHWTRHPSRLDRDLGRKKWGDAGYAKEELVAELGSAFLCADLGITPEARDDHAAYIASWLKALNDDQRLIFTAAAHAQRATDFLHGLQPDPTPEPAPPDRDALRRSGAPPAPRYVP